MAKHVYFGVKTNVNHQTPSGNQPVWFIRDAGPDGKYVERNINSFRAPILRSYVAAIKM